VIELAAPMQVRASRRELLKQSTQDLHVQLDARVAKLALTRYADYRDFLLRTAQALLPLESLLVKSGVSDAVSDWNARSRSEALRNDLLRLNGSCVGSELSRSAFNTSELFGALYVLEGSRLGGQILLRRARESDDERVRSNTRYLESNDAALWRSFLEELETAPVDVDESIRGARFTFEIFVSAFADLGSGN
jgi:heme oxygenase